MSQSDTVSKEDAAHHDILSGIQSQDGTKEPRINSVDQTIIAVFMLMVLKGYFRSNAALKKVAILQKACSRLAGPNAVSRPSNTPRLLGMRKGRGWHFEEDAFVSTQLKMKRPESTLRIWERRNKSLIESQEGELKHTPSMLSLLWHGPKGKCGTEDPRSAWRILYQKHTITSQENETLKEPVKKILFSNKEDEHTFFIAGVPRYYYQHRTTPISRKKVLPWTLMLDGKP